MKRENTFFRMLAFLKPYIPAFIISGIISLFVVLLEGASIWFVGTFPQVLFESSVEIPPIPPFDLFNLKDYFTAWTYNLIFGSSEKDPFFVISITIAIMFTIKNIIRYINDIILININSGILKNIRNFVFQKLLSLPTYYFDKNDSGKTVSLMTNDIGVMNNSITTALNGLIIEPIRLLITIGLLLIISVKLTLAILFLYPILSYIIILIGKSIKRKSRREFSTYQDLISVISETLIGIRVIKMFNAIPFVNKKFVDQNHENIHRHRAARKLAAINKPLNETISMYVTVSLLYLGGQFVVGTDDLSAGDFIRFLFLLLSSYQPFKSLGDINNTIQTGIAAGERVFSVIDHHEEKISVNHKLIDKIPFEKTLSFNDVSFNYNGYDEIVLNKINFEINKGEIIAIVGGSGSGKSTLLNLLPRFYEVSKGEIQIDNKDIREYELHEIRNLFGIVSQDNILFNDTVMNNIAYGQNNYNKDSVIEAAKAANAHTFITSLPNGYNTRIGERGITLSGGQRQRLSIARALFRNPEILILDEATSALDTESEKLVQEAIDKLITERTSFIVAHRLSTILHADRILVLENGKIVESGTHKELLALNKRYAYYYNIQFKSGKVKTNEE